MLFHQIIAGQTVPVHIHELAVSFVCINVSSKLKKRGKTKQTERMRLTQSGQRWRKVWKSGGPGGKYTLIVLVNFCPVLSEFLSCSFVCKNLIFWQKLSMESKSKLDFSTFLVFRPVFRYCWSTKIISRKNEHFWPNYDTGHEYFRGHSVIYIVPNWNTLGIMVITQFNHIMAFFLNKKADFKKQK